MNKHIYLEIKESLALSLPLISAWLIYSLAPFAGVAMIAHLGKDVLAASVLVSTIWIAAVTFWFGIFHSVSILVSHQLGAKNYAAISEVMGQALLLNIFSWIPIIALMLCVPLLIQKSAPNPAVLHYGTLYAHAILWSAPGLITCVIFEHFLSGIGYTRMSLMISLIEIPIEILLIYIFVYGKFGLPAFGIQGIGYGLAVSFTMTAIVLLIYLNYAKFMQPFQIFSRLGKFNFCLLKEIFRIGLPIGLTFFMELLTFTVATYFISRFNAVVLAAHQIIMQYLGVVINIPYAFAQGISIRVGMSVGKLDKRGAKLASYVGIGLGTIAAFIISVMILLFHKQLIAIDINLHDPQNTKLIQQSTALFFIFAFYQLFDSIRVVETGVLKGLKDTWFPLKINIIFFLALGIVAAYIFGINRNGQGVGVWAGLTLAMFICMVLLFWRVRRTLHAADFEKILKI